MKFRSKCCKKYKDKAKGCKDCPVLGPLTKKQRGKKLKKIKKRLARAA